MVTINKRIISRENTKNIKFLFLIYLIYNNSFILYKGNLVDNIIIITINYYVTLNTIISVRVGSLINYTFFLYIRLYY